MNEDEKQALIIRAEQLIKHAGEARDEIPFGLSDDVEGELALIKIALTALTAEPVGTFIQWDTGDEDTGPELEWVASTLKEAIPLYRQPVPPAPVAVPDEIIRDDADGYWMYKGKRVSATAKEWYNQAIADVKALYLNSGSK